MQLERTQSNQGTTCGGVRKRVRHAEKGGESHTEDNKNWFFNFYSLILIQLSWLTVWLYLLILLRISCYTLPLLISLSEISLDFTHVSLPLSSCLLISLHRVVSPLVIFLTSLLNYWEGFRALISLMRHKIRRKKNKRKRIQQEFPSNLIFSSHLTTWHTIIRIKRIQRVRNPMDVRQEEKKDEVKFFVTLLEQEERQRERITQNKIKGIKKEEHPQNHQTKSDVTKKTWYLLQESPEKKE